METPPKSEIILYQTEDSQARLEVRFEGESVADAGTDGGIVSDIHSEREYAAHPQPLCGEGIAPGRAGKVARTRQSRLPCPNTARH